MIRSFIALLPPREAVDWLEDVQADLTIGRLVPSENYHLTLAFLGEHPRQVLEDLHLELERIQSPPISLELDGLGMFGSARPRALYARALPSPELSHLRQSAFRAAEVAGIALKHEKFVPHVTLARFNTLGTEAIADLETYTARHVGDRAGPFEIDRFCLMRSELRREAAPVYDIMAEYPLGSAL